MFDRKVEIDELEQLHEKQPEDVANVLGLELEQEASAPDVLEQVDRAPEPLAAEDHGQPAWMQDLDLANHFTEDTVAETLVDRVHDLMADDVAALVHEHAALLEAENDPRFTEGMLPDFFADTAREIGTNDDPVDDMFVVASAHRGFLEDDSIFNGGGGGGGPPGLPKPPAGGAPPLPPLGEPPDPKAPPKPPVAANKPPAPKPKAIKSPAPKKTK
ncbi:MAG TPA: hypothetical protein VGC41_09015 [Kofleriaceae bacterium]